MIVRPFLRDELSGSRLTLDLEEYEKAIDSWKEAIKLEPDSADVHTSSSPTIATRTMRAY
jgi:tetratricopeptide (TPR) repeat protein